MCVCVCVCVRGVGGAGREGGVGAEGWRRWFAQTACGLEGGREAEIILRSQAFFPPLHLPARTSVYNPWRSPGSYICRP